MGRSAVIYARFSCSKQREASIEDQLRVCREWCDREGYGVVREYTDYAMSGLTDDRPSFREMIANAGESDIVLVYMMDRFSRSEYDAPIYKKELARHGVEVVSAMEALPDGPEKILIEKIYEGLAAVESAKTSIRVKRGMTGNAMKCMANGVRVYGYSVDADGRYAVDPAEAAFVREAFERRCAGETYHRIAADFARRGVVTATGRPCTPNMVERMLKSRKYTGLYTWGDVSVPGGMPAIVDEETFLRASRVRPRRRRDCDDWGDFALTGRIMCASCGRPMAGVSGRGRGDVKYEYYSCRGKCVKPVRRDWVEAEAVAGVRSLLASGDALSLARKVAAAAGGGAVEERRAELRAAVAGAQAGIENIVGAIERGVASDALQARLAALEDRKREARRELDSLSRRAVDPERLAAFLTSPGAMSDADVLDRFVYRAFISDEDVLVVLNYDTEKGEPAGLEVGRVRLTTGWCAI